MITLPPKANAKLAALQDAEAEAQAVVQSNTARIGILERALRNAPHGDNAGNIEFELSRLRALLGQHQQRFHDRATLNGRLRQWVGEQPHTAELSDAKPTKLKAQNSESPAAAVVRVRGEIATLVAERLDVRQAGLPVADMKAMARVWVAEHARKGRPDIRIDQEGIRVDFAAQTYDAPRLADRLCWLDPDRMLARLFAEIDAMPTSKLTLISAEREQRLGSIAAALLDLERIEEAWIEQAEANGHIIPRRTDANVIAVLGIVIQANKNAAVAA